MREARTSTSTPWSGRWSRRGPTRRGSGGGSSPSVRSSPSCANGSASCSSVRGRDVMRRLGDKIAAKLLAEQSEVPVAPWSGGPVESIDEARRHAAAIGYPLMIKATAGGGGRGIRRVDDDDGLAEAFDSARAEGLKAFGDATVFMERVVTDARHVEVQLIADTHGTVWAVGVRDCSMQRRNQKVIEESQCIALTPERGSRPAGRRGPPGRGGRVRERRDGRVPLPAGRAAVRVPGGQHPPSGRAPGHRADDRARPGEAADPRRRWAADWKAIRRRPSGTPSRLASTPRIPSAPSPPPRAPSRR